MQQFAAIKRAMQGARVTAGGDSEGAAKVCKLKDHPVTSGCTAVAALFETHRITVANCGDSRAVLCCKVMII